MIQLPALSSRGTHDHRPLILKLPRNRPPAHASYLDRSQTQRQTRTTNILCSGRPPVRCLQDRSERESSTSYSKGRAEQCLALICVRRGQVTPWRLQERSAGKGALFERCHWIIWTPFSLSSSPSLESECFLLVQNILNAPTPIFSKRH